MWGAIQCYDPTSINIDEGGWQVAFEYLASKTYSQTPSRKTLQSAGMPEMDSTYTTTMRKYYYVKLYIIYIYNTSISCI